MSSKAFIKNYGFIHHTKTLLADLMCKILNFQLILSMRFALVFVNDLDQTNDFILLPLCTVTKDKEHRSMVVKATWL